MCISKQSVAGDMAGGEELVDEGEDVADHTVTETLATSVVSRDTVFVTAEKERTDLREVEKVTMTGLRDLKKRSDKIYTTYRDRRQRGRK